MRILLAQLNYLVGDVSGNTGKILGAMDEARKMQADGVLFSELALCGYPPEDLLLHDAFLKKVESALEEIGRASHGLFVVVGTIRKNPDNFGKPLHNSAAVFSDGRLLGFHDKWLLPTYDVFDERRYFAPGRDVSVWEHRGKKIGITICEDLWQHAGYVGFEGYDRDPVKAFASQSLDCMLNLSASPYHQKKAHQRLEVGAKAALSLQCPVLLCCQVGANDALIFDGYSFCVDHEGRLVAQACGFEEETLLVDLGSSHLQAREALHLMEDLYKALVLGVRDYFRKTGNTKACLGLSGGIDSAVVACIAVEALGKENVVGIAMPSRYSSKASSIDAKDLARHLQIECLEIPIEPPFQSFLSLLQSAFQGKKEDVTEENLQARIRGVLLMAFANKHKYLVLNTGNKSELALGYCTLYGDMCGALGVLADVLKTEVYALALWINHKQEIIPLSTIEKPPSAELRPNQKDSDTLPPYEILDKVIVGYLEEELSCQEMALRWGLHEKEVLSLLRRMDAAEYKRQQAALGLRVSKKAFQIGRRYPIVQKWI